MIKQKFIHILGILILWQCAILCIHAQHPQDFGCKSLLPESINGYQPSIMPVLSHDGSRLYFSRKFHPDNIGGISDPDDIWFSTRLNDSIWSTPINAGPTINTEGSDVLFSLLDDGTTAFIGTTIQRNGVSFPCYALVNISKRENPKIQPILIREYDNSSPNYYAHLAADGKTLFLSTNNSFSRGGLDIYVSFRIGNSFEWSAPRSLGTTINTKGTEGSPCLGYDGETLYFSSDGHGGRGGQDLFMSRRLDSTWTKWSTPINLGALINSDGIDHCFSLTHKGDSAFIVSQTSGQRTSMYSICIPVSMRIKQTAPLRTPTQQQPHVDTLVLYFGSDSATDADTTSLRAFTSQFLQPKKRYTIRITPHTSASGTEQHNKNLAAARLRFVSEKLKNLRLPSEIKIEAGEHVSHSSESPANNIPSDRKVVIEVYVEE